MDSCQVLDYQNKFKLKASLLGGLENLKNIFQKHISSNNLPINHKKTIGVNISSIYYDYNYETRFEFYLWNVDCGSSYSSVRPTFYRGSEAIIVFISENKLEQISSYLQEIQFHLPVIHIIFCVILDKLNKENIIKTHFSNNELKEYSFEFNSIKTPSDILTQISDRFIHKRENQVRSDALVVDFLKVPDLFSQKEFIFLSEKDKSELLLCNDYTETRKNPDKINPSYRANTKILTRYIQLLGDYEIVDGEWVVIPHQEYGNFLIWLKSGEVYIIPKICRNCTIKKCKFKKVKKRHLCIEASSKGWSNRVDVNQKELLILSKIYAIIYSKLPKDVIEKLIKFNECKFR